MSEKLITHVAKEDQPGIFTLYKNNIACPCPKTAVVMPVQSAMGGGGLAVQKAPCSTMCPFADIEQADGAHAIGPVYKIKF